MREPIPSYSFVHVIVRLGRRFLLVHERKHGQTWSLPAGAVDPNESFADAARREALEETGLHVDLEGIVSVGHTPRSDYSRFQVIYIARPAGDDLPRATPNHHSLEAKWVTLEEARDLELRDSSVTDLLSSVLAGKLIVPCDFLGLER